MTRWIAGFGLMITFTCSLSADEESFYLNGSRLFHCISIRHEGKQMQDVSPIALVEAIKKSPDEFQDSGIYDRTSLCQLDGKRAWFSIITTRKEKNVIVLEYTADSGQHWRETVAPIAANQVKISFLNNQDGFLLATGAPSAGVMDKKVYVTKDGGVHWKLLNAPLARGYYPNGIVFRSLMDGWISATYHGGDAAPLYRTTDGGATWQLQSFEIPGDYQGGYVDTYTPLFFGAYNMKGILLVKLVRHEPLPDHEATVNYSSDDGGATWHLPATGFESTTGDKGTFHMVTLKLSGDP